MKFNLTIFFCVLAVFIVSSYLSKPFELNHNVHTSSGVIVEGSRASTLIAVMSLDWYLAGVDNDYSFISDANAVNFPSVKVQYTHTQFVSIFLQQQSPPSSNINHQSSLPPPMVRVFFEKRKKKLNKSNHQFFSSARQLDDVSSLAKLDGEMIFSAMELVDDAWSFV